MNACIKSHARNITVYNLRQKDLGHLTKMYHVCQCISKWPRYKLTQTCS